jgi:chemotaxis protein MotA
MDIATLVGLLVAFGFLILAFLMEGGGIGMLIVGTAFLIVFGGTIGATIISYSLEEIKRVPYYLKSVFKNLPLDYDGAMESLVICAEKARREGFLSLEDFLPNIENQFLVRGLQMVIDGTEPELTRDILEREIEVFEKNELIGYEMFMTAGGFAPTMGIIGTVMGMVTVLSNLSSPEELGGSIAVAFLATLYGISSANILFIPFANKIKMRVNSEVFMMEMIEEGILSIQNGENPRLIREKLSIFLPAESHRRPSHSTAEKVGI